MIPVREDIQFHQHEGIFYYLNDAIVTESDKKEFIAHEKELERRASLGDQGDDLFFYDVIYRSDYIKTFNKLIPKLQLSGTETILEMGGGFCWASTLVKREYPNTYVVGSDLILSNLEYTGKFEKTLNASLDEKWVFHCGDLPFASCQFDRIFTFAAFHHFGEDNDFTNTIKEMVRVLKPQGKIILLYEPSAPKYLYGLAFKRVNRDPYADEDVLVLSKLEQCVTSLNCQFSAEFFPGYEDRSGITETIYYYVLTKLGILQKLLPCTVNIFIEKGAGSRLPFSDGC